MRPRALWVASLAFTLALGARVAAAQGEGGPIFETPYEAGFRENEQGELVLRDRVGRWTATLLPDGRIRFEDDLGPYFDKRRGGVAVPGPNELIPAARGYDFSQARKRRLLRATAQMRLEMAASYAAGNMDDELARLSDDLAAIWRDRSKPATARRLLIFLRWDECEQSPASDPHDVVDESTSRVDAMRQRAGERARDEIAAFVRAYLPEGGANAYTADELRRLNEQRTSRERFDPYAIEPGRVGLAHRPP